MKASQFFISTLKEAPADAEIVSHKLMMRALMGAPVPGQPGGRAGRGGFRAPAPGYGVLRGG